MITKLIGESGFPKTVDISATSTIDGMVCLNVYLPQDGNEGIGSTEGKRIGRVCMRHQDAVKLIAELAKAISGD